ncbi:MAG TPA: NifU family protein [candidate division Zixibacteria bacterium]|nr:NifU family protein [candidate division Zixibacteria bacterium]MDD4918518.1 NifU family protein [candidate division Zixibacteria bacterium]MDM7973388.1 NifU family protein [candidate division Zixibacteria bacterium]HOD67369.1 NifU family protein [candidate division Zixibacteria bacterium]HOZ07427.1 NifU family protein [candidate division Zixibacteria bacterium]
MTDNKIAITGEPTRDPGVCRFIVDRPVFADGTVNCRSKEAAAGSPLLEALFAIDGIAEVMVSGNTLTIAKTTLDPWPVLGRRIGAAIREQINSGRRLIDPAMAKKTPSEEEIRRKVARLFEEQINPAISSHGGFVELHDVEGTTVYVRLGGGCQGCASANATLRHGIERAIREEVPEVSEVRDVTDHTAGMNPYY